MSRSTPPDHRGPDAVAGLTRRLERKQNEVGAMFGFRIAQVQHAAPGPRHFAAISTAARRWRLQSIAVEGAPFGYLECWTVRIGTRLRHWREPWK